MQLTDLSVKSLVPPEKGQQFHFDGSVTGFAVRVSQGGAKSFVLKYGRDRRLVTIGRYPTLTLAQARTEAKRLLAEFTLGKVRPQSITYQAAVELFLKDKAQARRPSTVHGYKNKLARLKFQGPVADITHAEAARKLDRIKAPSEKSHVLVAAKVFFHWCIARRYLTENPFTGLTKPTLPPRQRILTDDEIRALWKVEGRFADYVKLLLLTGQRRSELLHATIDGDLLTIPAHISKNHKENIIPLMPLARRYWQPFRYFDWSLEKRKLDAASGVMGWVLHDCRRSFKTNLSKLRTPPYISERILNHISSRGALEDTYDLHTYLPEMRTALAQWEEYLSKLLQLA